MKDENLLETVSAYGRLIGQLSDMLRRLVDLCTKQQIEIQQCKEIASCEDIARQENAEQVLTEAMQLLEQDNQNCSEEKRIALQYIDIDNKYLYNGLNGGDAYGTDKCKYPNGF